MSDISSGWGKENTVAECGEPERVSLYDEEGVEGWRWTHPDGREWTEIGNWSDGPPAHPLLGASSADAADRVTDASHRAPTGLGPSGSVPTGASGYRQQTVNLPGFTPGPWRLEDAHSSGNDCYYNRPEGAAETVAITGGECDFCLAILVTDCFERPEIEANARLIAAAPSLYEALVSARAMIASLDGESGYCMCGDPVEGHNFGSGHSPVDSHSYVIGQALEKIDAALSLARGERNG